MKKIYRILPVEALCGIKINNAARLNSAKIYSVWDMYSASIQKLTSAFKSVLGFYWHTRLHGYEIDDAEFSRKSYGQSYAIYHATDDKKELAKILCKLVEKMGMRMRKGGFSSQGIHLACQYSDLSFWHHGEKTKTVMYSSADLFKQALKLLLSSPYQKPVRLIAVSCFSLEKNNIQQIPLFHEDRRRNSLIGSIDRINERFGLFTIFPATMMQTQDKIPDRIAFGGIKELEETVFKELLEYQSIS